jgi:hypothetical protein
LESLGYKVVVKNQVDDDGLWIGIWNKWPTTELPKQFINWNTEPISGLNHSVPVWPRFKKAIQNWDYAEGNLKHYKKVGLEAKHVPLAYSEYYELAYKEPVVEKDIDFLFYGTPTARRRHVIRTLRRHGFNITWLGENERQDFRSLKWVEKERNAYIARSKIVLSIARDINAGTNDLSRLMFCIANKVFTIGERTGDKITEDLWAQYLPLCETENELVAHCKRYISDEVARISITENAYAFARNSYRLEEFIPEIP